MSDLSLLGAVAAGGALGSAARYGIARAWPAAAAGVDWAPLVTNAAGCFLIGVLMVLVEEVWSGKRLLRPFLGVGVLGGFTTFSSYAVIVADLAAGGRPVAAAGYLAGTVLAALAATWLGMVVTRTARRSR